MKWIFCAAFFLSFVLTQAQLVNTEKLRKDKKEDGFSGEVSLNGSFLRNTRSIYRAGSFSRLEYRKAASRLMLFTSFNFSEADKKSLVNNGYLHLRFNRELNDNLTLEAFSQVQYNQIQIIRARMIQGIGPRFKLIQNDTLSMFVGSLYMYEYEEISDDLQLNKHYRLSTYISCGYAFSKTFSLDHITYYQPRPDRFRDYRILTETLLTFTLYQNLSFQFSFNLLFDSKPPDPTSIPESIYSIANGLSYTF
ncbi:MAG: DUF481 domain-containing protein [Bacteroidota bacterium]